MDRNVRLHDRNTVRRASSWAEHMELSQDFDSVHSLPNDLRFRLVPPDPYCNALRVGDLWKMGWITRTAEEAGVMVPQQTGLLETVPS